MESIRRLTMLLVLTLGASALPAQDEGGEAGEAGDAPGPAETSETTAPPAEPPPQDEESAGAAAERVRGEEDVFVPTEELDADEEVTFPVDI